MPDSDLCEFCHENEKEPGLPCCSTQRCLGEYYRDKQESEQG
jgi:hypothetical protein